MSNEDSSKKTRLALFSARRMGGAWKSYKTHNGVRGDDTDVMSDTERSFDWSNQVQTRAEWSVRIHSECSSLIGHFEYTPVNKRVLITSVP